VVRNDLSYLICSLAHPLTFLDCDSGIGHPAVFRAFTKLRASLPASTSGVYRPLWSFGA
jgi:hypothetical protein